MNECKDCNYKTEDKSNYKKHLESKKHLNNINKLAKSTKSTKSTKNEDNYICKECDYKTEDKSNYNKHLESKKHLKNTSSKKLFSLLTLFLFCIIVFKSIVYRK